MRKLLNLMSLYVALFFAHILKVSPNSKKK